VLTIQSGINQAAVCHTDRHQTGEKQAAAQGDAAEVRPALGENLQKIERLYIPQKTKKTETIEGTPGEIGEEAGREVAQPTCACFSCGAGTLARERQMVEVCGESLHSFRRPAPYFLPGA